MSYDTFISYSRTDRALVEPLVQLMRLSGRSVFWDGDSIEPGQKWADVLKESIGTCKQLLLVWCCHSSGSDQVQIEIDAALAVPVPIVPLLLCNHLPDGAIAEYQWIDMRQQVTHMCDGGATRGIPAADSDAALIDPSQLLQGKHIQGFDGRDDKLPEIPPDRIDSYYFDALRPNAVSSALKLIGLRTGQVRRFDDAQILGGNLSTEQKNFAGFALRAIEESDFDPRYTLPTTTFR